MDAVLDLADLAAEQWGLVTAAQARAVGVSNQMAARLTARGTLERLAYGVYRVTGAPAGPLDGLRAAWLVLDPARRAVERIQDETPIVVSHRAAAAAVYRYGDLDGDVYEFTAPVRRQSRRADVRFHLAAVPAEDWRVIDGLPVTTPERTIVDLAAARIDGGHLAAVVRDAVMGFDVDEEQLAQRLRPYAHHYGAPLGEGAQMIQSLLDDAGVQASPQLTAAALKTLTASMDTAGFAAALEAANTPAMHPLARAVAAQVNAPVESVRHLLAEANAPTLRAFSRLLADANAPAMEPVRRMLAEANAPTVRALSRLLADANAPAMEPVRRMLAQANAPALEAARKSIAAAAPAMPTMPNVPKAYADVQRAARALGSSSSTTMSRAGKAESAGPADDATGSEDEKDGSQ